MIKLRDFTERIYEMSEDTTYAFMDKFDDSQNIDRSMTYIYIKAFYIHIIKLYLTENKKLSKFNLIYEDYKKVLIGYYKYFNQGITNDFINDITEAYEKSYEMMESLKFKELYDGYEFRHHIVDCFELLRNVLENKSGRDIRVDIFEDYISKFRKQAEDIIGYVSLNLKNVK